MKLQNVSSLLAEADWLIVRWDIDEGISLLSTLIY